MSSVISAVETFAGLPPEWPEDLLPWIRARLKADERKIVVLDDDPTGTQTVHGVPVLTEWSLDAITRELQGNAGVFYILTNSRSLTGPDARQLGIEIGNRLKSAAEQTGVAIEVISRSDSTLRGHFPGEVDALKAGLHYGNLPSLLVPFFLEGGRYTIDDVHYVAEGERLVPAARTPYARDAVFGYRHSNLRHWIEEKTRGRVPAERVFTIALDDLRRGGPATVAEKLVAMPPGAYGIVNAVAYRDLEVFIAGLLQAEAGGAAFVFRTAASFVRVRAGIAPREVIRPEELAAANDHGGLFLVGSHVPKTTAQLTALLNAQHIAPFELRVADLMKDSARESETQRVVQAVNRSLRQGMDTVVFTSRRLLRGTGAEESLGIGRRVSEGLIRIVQELACQPRYLVAKGGITSSDVATRGLGVRRAVVRGQILPGVPVWTLGDETRYPGMAYIVFPGNVGDDQALAAIQKRLADPA